MSIPARYSGLCIECPDPIVDALMAPARTGEVSCPACFLIHPEGACDR